MISPTGMNPIRRFDRTVGTSLTLEQTAVVQASEVAKRLISDRELCVCGRMRTLLADRIEWWQAGWRSFVERAREERALLCQDLAELAALVEQSLVGVEV
jgi:hypothetical protein